MRLGRVRSRGAVVHGVGRENPIEMIWYVDDDAPPAPLDFAVEHCACGEDHLTVPVGVDGQPLVCREHKRHEPCVPCLRRRRQGRWDGHV